MKKILLLIYIIMHLINSKTNAQWHSLPRNDSTIWYDDVQFLNKDTGYYTMLTGYLRGNVSHLYATKNGGKTWNYVDSFFGDAFFHYFDYNRAIFSYAGFANKNDTVKPIHYRLGFWYSKDGGRTRDSIPNTWFLAPPLFISRYTGFANEGGGIAPYLSSGPLFKARDGGMHWYKVSNYYVYARNIRFPSDTLTGYYTNINDKNDTISIIKTSDAGEHWKKIYSHVRKDPTETFIFKTKDIIIDSWDTLTLISKDGGNTWRKSGFPRGNPELYKFTVFDSTNIYGSAEDYIAKDSQGLGFNWMFTTYLDSLFYPDIYLTDKDFAYAFSPGISSTEIYVLKNASKWTGIPTSVKIVEPFFHDEAIELFPNPAQNTVTLKGYGFSAAADGRAVLYCRDMLGRTILQRELKASNDGTIQETLNISNFSQGIYEVTVIQGNKMEQTKLMVR